MCGVGEWRKCDERLNNMTEQDIMCTSAWQDFWLVFRKS